MRRDHRLSFSIILYLVLSLSASGSTDIVARIGLIESFVDGSLRGWEVAEASTGQDEGLPQEKEWRFLTARDTLRQKNFWLRNTFIVPEVFAATKTSGSRIDLGCLFRGTGVMRGSFFCNGGTAEEFRLEFGNASSEVHKTFLLTQEAKPGDKLALLFRFENLGKTPLLEKKEAEAGTFFQLRDSRFGVQAAEENLKILSRFLAEIKAGAYLLDLLPREEVPDRLRRPAAKDSAALKASQEFRSLQEGFSRALEEIRAEAFVRADGAAVREDMARFYKRVEPLSRFARSRTAFLAANSHIDLAWLWRWPETVEVARATFSTVMDNMEEYPEMVYVQSQAQAYKWVEENHPEVFERIRHKVQEGRWEVIGGMWAEPDCNLIDGESFIRQILYGKRYFREKFGVDVKIGWNPDSFGYNWNMPQFFRKSGIEAFITQKISWNDTNVFPYFLFWWEGPDGSRVLTYFPPTGYVGTLSENEILEGTKLFEENTSLKEALILYGLGDHGGGPNREMLDRARGFENRRIFPRLKHSSVTEYLGRLSAPVRKNLPVWKDELYLEYHRGTFTTQAETKKFNRKSEVLLADAEKISSVASLFGSPDRKDDLARAWEKILTNQFHDILPGSSIPPVYRDAKELYIQARKLASGVLEEGLGLLAGRIDTAGGPPGRPLVVFNTLSWERHGVVEARIPAGLEKDFRLVDENGAEVPVQILPSEGEFLFIARNVPPGGYRVYKAQEGRPSPAPTSLKLTGTTLENMFFRVALNPETGNIEGLTDKVAGREVLAPSAQGNRLELLEDIPSAWEAWNIGYTGREWILDRADEVTPEAQGPLMASLKVKKSYLGLSKARRSPTPDFPSSFFTQEVILYEGIPLVVVRMTADWWEDHVLLKASFPVNVQSRKAVYEIPFAFVERPTARDTDWERARFEVPAIRWADLSDGEYGVSLLNESKYGHDIKDNIMRLTLLRSPLWPDPLADRGKHEFSYALYPHEGTWREADTVRKGYEFNVPLLARWIESQGGELPPVYSFFEASPSAVILAAVKKAEDRKSLILRLYESQGADTEAVLRFFRTPREAYLVDLMENRVERVPAGGKEILLRFGRSEIKSLELVF